MSNEPGPDFYRERIRQAVRRVPEKVNAGGVELAKAYKKVVGDALKQLNSSRATLINLKLAAQRLENF